MKKRNFLTTAALAALVAAQMAMPIMAAPATNATTGDQHTTIGILESATKPADQASFDVPLYLVVAAVDQQGTIAKPDNYVIKNLSTGTDAKAIGVTKMQVENLAAYDENNLANSGWVIVDQSADKDNSRKISLQLGSQWLPSTETAGVNNKVLVDFAESSFFRGADKNGEKTYTKIEPGKTLAIAVNGTVQSTTRTDKKASSQFKVTYTVSPLDDDGKVLSAVYVGDDKTDAGLN